MNLSMPVKRRRLLPRARPFAVPGIPRSILAMFLLFLFAAAFDGCATTNQVVSQWSNPAYASPSFKRIMIGATGSETSIRRNLEDEFVSELRASGIEALPSYRYISEDQTIDEAKLKQAAKKAGADAAILARSIGVERRSEYRDYYPYPAVGIFGPHIGATWSLSYGLPSVRRYDVYTSEATLYDLNKNEVVWTGTVKTAEPDDVTAATREYVQTVINALKQKNILTAGGSQ